MVKANKRGRPAKPPGDRLVKIAFRTSPEQKALLDETAARLGSDPSNLLRMLLTRHLPDFDPLALPHPPTD